MSAFDAERLLALSTAVARLLAIDTPAKSVAGTVVDQMIREGLRKLHDTAVLDGKRCKYRGHPFWSRDASRHFEGSNRRIGRAKSGLRHEHVVPVGEVVKLLRRYGPSPTVEQVQTVIDQMSIVAIITVEEDRHLSSIGRTFEATDFLADRWIRYREPLSKLNGDLLIQRIPGAPQGADPFVER
jgi:hypothetical protein